MTLKKYRVLSWVKETIDDKGIIGENSLTDVYMRIDATYAVYSDMRSHNGVVISMGHEVLHEKVSVQRISKKGSTEAELVGVSEYLSCNLWLTTFFALAVICNNNQYNVPRQPKCNEYGEK